MLVGCLLVSVVTLIVICYENLIYDWSVFFDSRHIYHISYIIIIQRSSFLLSKRDSISPYDSFSSSVVLSNVFFLFDPKIYKLLLFNWIIIRLLRNISFFFIFSVMFKKFIHFNSSPIVYCFEIFNKISTSFRSSSYTNKGLIILP